MKINRGVSWPRKHIRSQILITTRWSERVDSPSATNAKFPLLLRTLEFHTLIARSTLLLHFYISKSKSLTAEVHFS